MARRSKSSARGHLRKNTNIAHDEHPISLDPDGIDHLVGVFRRCMAIQAEIDEKTREKVKVLNAVRGYGINTSAVKMVLKRLFQRRYRPSIVPDPFEGVDAEDAIAYWSILLTVEEFYEYQRLKDEGSNRSGDS